MDRLLAKSGKTGRGAAHNGRHKNWLTFADPACRPFRDGCQFIAKPANEIACRGMQLRGAAFIFFCNALQLQRQIQPVAGNDQHIRNLL